MMTARYIKGPTENDAIRSFLALGIKKHNVSPSLDLIMREVGEFYEADRSYIFEKDETDSYISNTLEWCKEGIAPEIQNLQGIPLHLAKPWFDEFRNKGSFYLSCNENYAESNPLIYEYLEPQGIDSLLAVPLVTDGEVIGFLGVDNPRKHCHFHLLLSVIATYTHNILIRNREIAEREALHKKQMQEERIRADYEAAEKANLAKSHFLFSMSHDIRTPMNAIMGYNKLIQREAGDKEKVLHYQGKIELASRFLLSLINNVLDMARIESGKMHLDEMTHSAGCLIPQLLDVLKAEADKKHITLSYVNQLKDQYISFDYAKVSEIFSNLISNAVKYTPPGGHVKITNSEYPVCREGYVGIQTVVEDDGIGMSAAFLKRIFEPFEREQKEETRHISGTGLGMSIVKKYVDFMEGYIEIESQPGRGTRITVRLPHKKVAHADDSRAQQPEQQERVSGALKAGKRILLAEDNELNAEIATELLRQEGFQIDHVADGNQCVEKIMTQPAGTYDVILMDVQMPEMNGYEATKAIRALVDKEKATIPILAMTAGAFSEDRKLALEAGMDGFCTKPIDMELLKAELAKVL